MDSAFVGSYRDINRASAFVVLADALYRSHLFLGNLFGVQSYPDLGSQLLPDIIQRYQLHRQDVWFSCYSHEDSRRNTDSH